MEKVGKQASRRMNIFYSKGLTNWHDTAPDISSIKKKRSKNYPHNRLLTPIALRDVEGLTFSRPSAHRWWS
jgi:hypothetical protein